jgi:hypothetical protein
MYLLEHTRRILMIVAQLSNRDSNAGIMYMTIVRESPDLPMSEILEHLNELCLYGLIRRGERVMKGCSDKLFLYNWLKKIIIS